MTTPVLLIDDGELADVREVLDEMGVSYSHLRGGSVPSQIDPPSQLFIATSRRAVLASDWPPGSLPVKVGVVTEDSNTLRNMLKRIGFDLLVRRPVHPHALRLILLKAMYSGEERRREQRHPVGCTVALRSGLRRKNAVLADLSQRGCLLLSDTPHAAGTKLNIQLPKSLGSRAITLKSRVVRCNDRPDPEGQYAVGLAFEQMKSVVAAELRDILRGRREGPVVFDQDMPSRPAAQPLPEAQAPAETAAPEAPLPAESDEHGSGEDRRAHGRAPYRSEIVSLEGEASLVLLGRDISVGGMRVESNSDLKVGNGMRLAIYGEAREEPFIVHASVEREEADGSFGLRFERVQPALAARLEQLVAKLPAVESLEGDEADALGSVVSQILEEN
jgi:hypothetical protein